MNDAFRWDDPEDVKRWISALRSAVHDALAAGEDATRRLSERVLSRAEARRKLREAEKRIDSLLDVAESVAPTAVDLPPSRPNDERP